MHLRNLAIAGFILSLPTVAGAQQPAEPTAPQSRIVWHVGSGSAITLGETRDRFGNGVLAVLGATYETSRGLDVQFEYGATWHDLKGEFFELPTFDGNQQLQYVDFNVRMPLTPAERTLRFYVVGGPGFYWRNVEITRPGGGSSPLCDPYLLLCREDGSTVELGSRSSWGVGVSLGGGITLPVSESLTLYVESRFHFIRGPELDVPAALQGTVRSAKANGHFMPIAIGLRF